MIPHLVNTLRLRETLPQMMVCEACRTMPATVAAHPATDSREGRPEQRVERPGVPRQWGVHLPDESMGCSHGFDETSQI